MTRVFPLYPSTPTPWMFMFFCCALGGHEAVSIAPLRPPEGESLPWRPAQAWPGLGRLMTLTFFPWKSTYEQ